MIITQDFVIGMAIWAIVGIFGFAVYISFLLAALIRSANKSQLRRMAFERSLCLACKEKLYQYKAGKLKD